MCLLAAVFGRLPFAGAPLSGWIITGAVAALALLFSLPRRGELTAPWPEQRWAPPAGTQRWIMLASVVVAILAMWPRSALLEQSLTEPEVRQLQTLEEYRATTGQMLSRLSIPAAGPVQLELARALGGKLVPGSTDTGLPNERLLRTPAWIAGILSTILIALLGTAMGSPRSGLAAGLLLSMHPEHVRWSATAGSSATGLLFLLAVLLCLISWLRSGRFGWWLGLTAAQAGALLSGHAELLAVNAVAGVLLWLGPGTPRERTTRMLHLAAALTAALGTLLFSAFTIFASGGPPASLADTFSRWFTGLPWRLEGITDQATSLTALAGGTPWRGMLLYALLPVCIAAGLYFMVVQDWRTRFVSLSLLVTILLPSGAALAGDHREAPALLLMALTPVWAGAGLMRRFPRNRRLLFAPLVAGVLYVMATSPVLQRLMRIPRQPVEQVIKTAHPDDARDPKILTATFGPSSSTARLYDPAVQLPANTAALDALVDEALKTDHSLLVYYRPADVGTPEWAGMQEEIERSGRFRPVRQVSAFDPRESYRLYRYDLREQIIRMNLSPEK